jgi:outer membrane biosynthesis protein TonB
MTMFEKFTNWFFGRKKTEEVIAAPYKLETPEQPAPVPTTPAISAEPTPETPKVTEETKKPRGKPRGQAKKKVDTKKVEEPTKAVAKMTTTRKSKKSQL